MIGYWLAVAILAGGFRVGVAAAAADCAETVERLCPGLVPGDGKFGPCIAKHGPELPKECAAFVVELRRRRSLKSAADACAADASKFCAGVKPAEAKFLPCIQDRKHELSDRCLSAASALFNADGMGQEAGTTGLKGEGLLFNTLGFIYFFSFFSVIYHLLLSRRLPRLWFITAASLFFYGMWDYRFVPLLAGTALADFCLARAIENFPGHRRKFLWLSIILNVGTLSFFKYTNFFSDSAYGLLRFLGISDAPAPVFGIVLPVGISFYTFQSMGYVIDVYRGHLRARRHPVEMLAGVTFFPHLVAGPIIRATNMLPQFENIRQNVSDWMLRRGVLLFSIGLLKKGLGDLLGKEADRFYSFPGPHSVLESWTGSLAFTGQIYADFSGYTDMAIGIALLLGFELPANFNQPFLATSAADFWRRWHISLSSWLKDYVYEPLGGREKRYRNLMLTMLISGLWHGANWTFVAWGAFHGVFLIASHRLGRSFGSAGFWATKAGTSIKIALTFYLINLSFVIFRAKDLAQALSVAREMHWPQALTMDPLLESRRLLFVVTAIAAGHLINGLQTLGPAEDRRGYAAWAVAGSLLALGIAANGSNTPFIYFQF